MHGVEDGSPLLDIRGRAVRKSYDSHSTSRRYGLNGIRGESETFSTRSSVLCLVDFRVRFLLYSAINMVRYATENKPWTRNTAHISMSIHLNWTLWCVVRCEKDFLTKRIDSQ